MLTYAITVKQSFKKLTRGMAMLHDSPKFLMKKFITNTYKTNTETIKDKAQRCFCKIMIHSSFCE